MKSKNFDFAVLSATTLLRECRSRGLRCRDPPLATSRLLLRLGLNQYQVRDFWEDVAEEAGRSYTLYKYKGAMFSLSAAVRQGKLLHIDGWLPADFYDCNLRRDSCQSSPRGQALYVYVSGSVEGSEIRVNVINLLYMLDVAVSGAAERILESVRRAIWSNSVDELVKEVIDIARCPGLGSIRLVLPKVPENEDDVAKLVPLLRRALK